MTTRSTTDNADYRPGSNKRNELIDLHDEIKHLLDATKSLHLSPVNVNVHAKIYSADIARKFVAGTHTDENPTTKPLQALFSKAEFLLSDPQFQSSSGFNPTNLQGGEPLRVEEQEESMEFRDPHHKPHKGREVHSGMQGSTGPRNQHRREHSRKSDLPEIDEVTGHYEDETPKGHVSYSVVDGKVVLRKPPRGEREKRSGFPGDALDAGRDRQGGVFDFENRDYQKNTSILEPHQHEPQGEQGSVNPSTTSLRSRGGRKPGSVASDSDSQDPHRASSKRASGKKKYKGKYSPLPYHNERTEPGYNPFGHGHNKSAPVQEGFEHCNPFKYEHEKEQQAIDEPVEDNQPKSHFPIFKNPYNFQNGEVKDHMHGPHDQEEERYVQEEEEIIVEPVATDQGIYMVTNNPDPHKKRVEKVVRSDFNPEEAELGALEFEREPARNRIPQSKEPHSKVRDSVRREESNFFRDTIRSVKEWVDEKIRQLSPNRQQRASSPNINGRDFYSEINPEEQFQSSGKINLDPGHHHDGHHRYRSAVDEGRGSAQLDVRNELPDWYKEKNFDTDLIENMYIVDAVRYTNFQSIHHPHYQSPLKKSSASGTNKQHREPLRDSPPNMSRKLEPDRTATKSDKKVPRIICFVTKYHGGDLEEDNDRDEQIMNLGTADLKRSHDSPYFEKDHQNSFRPGQNPLKNSSYGLRQPINVEKIEDDGYFDVERYKQIQRNSANLHELEHDVEEDEGIKQTVRISLRTSLSKRAFH